MRSCLCVALLVFPACLAQIILQENMPCRNSVSKKPGICRKEVDCPIARLQNARPCSYIGGQKIACCDLIGQKVGEIALQKCVEYSRVNLQSANVSLVDDEPEEAPPCSLGGQVLIAGGTEAESKEFPHMVCLGFDESDAEGIKIDWSCGGTLISERYVLTAGHCLYNPSKTSPRIAWARLGALDLNSVDEADILTKRIIDWKPHPDYKSPSSYHDIALLKLEDAVVFNEYIRPACLNVDFVPDAGFRSIASGWGEVRTGGGINSMLMKVRIPVVGHDGCNKSFATLAGSRRLKRGIDDDLQLCAGESGKDTCQGYSGGPLQVRLTEPECMYRIIGVTSMGPTECGSLNAVGVYTRVSKYVSWIEGIVWP